LKMKKTIWEFKKTNLKISQMSLARQAFSNSQIFKFSN
jgi:hypothetical protein